MDREIQQIREALEKHGSDAFEEAKKNGGAVILEKGWIVKVLPDNTRVRLKYVGDNFVKVKQRTIKLK